MHTIKYNGNISKHLKNFEIIKTGRFVGNLLKGIFWVKLVRKRLKAKEKGGRKIRGERIDMERRGKSGERGELEVLIRVVEEHSGDKVAPPRGARYCKAVRVLSFSEIAQR